jgi:hypothetical protein
MWPEQHKNERMKSKWVLNVVNDICEPKPVNNRKMTPGECGGTSGLRERQEGMRRRQVEMCGCWAYTLRT